MPGLGPIPSQWFYINWWGREIFYFIRAETVDHIDLDLRRVKWAEILKVIPIFIFWATDYTKKIVRGGIEVSQNRWVYERILTVLPRDRVAIFERKVEHTPVTKDLPVLPRVYRILEITKYPPTFKRVKACDYHFYKDEHPDIDVENEYD